MHVAMTCIHIDHRVLEIVELDPVAHSVARSLFHLSKRKRSTRIARVGVRGYSLSRGRGSRLRGVSLAIVRAISAARALPTDRLFRGQGHYPARALSESWSAPWPAQPDCRRGRDYRCRLEGRRR